jgi:RNA polymerase sigma-70 factor (ECF subfamily)
MQHIQITSSQIMSGAASSTPSPAKVTSDETLVGLIAQGDKDAMRLLMARHNARVLRFLMRFVRNEATAEELLNEVFIEVWRHAGRFESRSQVSTWILAIARFKALAALRRRQPDELDDDAFEAIEDTADDPEIAIQKTQRSAILQDCLKQLSIAHREVVDLFYYQDQSIEEVAETIGVPQSTVKTRVFYARRRIAELMAERGVERAWL